MVNRSRDPRTKEEFLDRMLSYDFNGDIRDIGAEPASVVRTGANSLRLRFPASGQTFDLTVHKPRGEQPAARVAAEPRSFQSEDGDGRARLEPAPEEAPRRRKRSAATGRQAERREARG